VSARPRRQDRGHLQRRALERAHARRRRRRRPAQDARARLPLPIGAREAVIAADKRRSYLARQVGTLALAHVRTQNPMAVVRAAAWANRMGRLGVHLPLFLVHDLGILLTAPRGTAGVQVGPNEPILNALGLPADARA